MKWFIVAFIAYALVILIAIAGIVYVVAHFLIKIW